MEEGDEQRFVDYSGQLADQIESVLSGWVERSVRNRVEASGRTFDAELAASAVAAGERCREEIAPQVRALLVTDLDEQRSTPLSILRAATSYATEVLLAAGVAPVQRDEFQARAFPSDVYALSPASFSDVDEALGEPGLVWGAAKAHVHLARRRNSVGPD